MRKEEQVRQVLRVHQEGGHDELCPRLLAARLKELGTEEQSWH